MRLLKSGNRIFASIPGFLSEEGSGKVLKNDLTSWVLACRPKTLTAALAPIWVGTALVQSSAGVARWDLAAFALLCSFLIQIGTNLINDASDFEKGADTSERVGPKRVTQSGLLSLESVWWGAGICFLLAVIFSLPLVFTGGWPIVIIGLLSLLAGYAYTAGPFPLAYLGLGDLFVLIFFGWVAVCGIVFLNTGTIAFSEIALPALIAGTQVGLLATVLIAVNNLRDHLTDRKVGKKTLAVRLGLKGARLELTLLILLPFALNFYWFVWNSQQKAVPSLGPICLPWLMFPLGVRILKQIYKTEPSAAYNSILAQAAFLHFGFSLLLGIGFLLT